MNRKAIILALLLAAVGMAMIFGRDQAPPGGIPVLTAGKVVRIVIALALALATVALAAIWVVRNHNRVPGRQWIAVGVGIACSAPFLGWLWSTRSLTPTLVFVAIALVPVIKGITQLRWEQTKVIRKREHCCIQCGYDLTGNVSGVCPECGTSAGTDV